MNIPLLCNSLCFTDSMHGWIAVERNPLRTIDGGETWQIESQLRVLLRTSVEIPNLNLPVFWDYIYFPFQKDCGNDSGEGEKSEGVKSRIETAQIIH